MTLVALVLVAALNPLVLRSPEPHGNVPANCEVSDAPASPRVAAAARAEVDNPAVALPTVRPAARAQSPYDLKPLQTALAANNRPQFDAELARAREAGAPTRVYDDVARLWDAQFESPFFTEGSEPHRIASQYPGYEAAVREQIFTDASGRKFYPASESRAFVARQTGTNLPTRTTRTTTQQPSTKQPSNRATQQPTTRTTTRQPDNRTTRKPTPATPQPRPPVARQDPAPPRRSPDPSAAQKSAATVPAPVVPPVENTSSTTAPPAAGSLPADPVTTTTSDAALTDTMVTDTLVTDTTATALDTATTAATTTGTAAAPGRSIVLPAILILIGLGVLILLFKAK